EASTFDRLMRIRHVWIEALHPPLSRKRQRHEVHITDTDPDRDNGKSILQTCDISVSITGRTDAKAFTELMKSLSELVDTHRRNGQRRMKPSLKTFSRAWLLLSSDVQQQQRWRLDRVLRFVVGRAIAETAARKKGAAELRKLERDGISRAWGAYAPPGASRSLSKGRAAYNYWSGKAGCGRNPISRGTQESHSGHICKGRARRR